MSSVLSRAICYCNISNEAKVLMFYQNIVHFIKHGNKKDEIEILKILINDFF